MVPDEPVDQFGNATAATHLLSSNEATGAVEILKEEQLSDAISFMAVPAEACKPLSSATTKAPPPVAGFGDEQNTQAAAITKAEGQKENNTALAFTVMQPPSTQPATRPRKDMSNLPRIDIYPDPADEHRHQTQQEFEKLIRGDNTAGVDSNNQKSNNFSFEKLQKLAASQDSLPIRMADAVSQARSFGEDASSTTLLTASTMSPDRPVILLASPTLSVFDAGHQGIRRAEGKRHRDLTIEIENNASVQSYNPIARPIPVRALSTPVTLKSPRPNLQQDTVKGGAGGSGRDISRSDDVKARGAAAGRQPPTTPNSVPLPPFSISAHLQLEMSSNRPFQQYSHKSAQTDVPYESSHVKIERLMNFLLLPPHLEGVLLFGTLACLDAWLYTFTILPLRFSRSLWALGLSFTAKAVTDIQSLSTFVYDGMGRLWQRRRTRGDSAGERLSHINSASDKQNTAVDPGRKRPQAARYHRRARPVPSTLLPDDKADILKGLLIICTCLLMLRLDASRMYHWIRGQAAIKLYVIYNVLEVCDRLFSAIGQDVLECLFSRETLERKADGHSKVLRPLWLFLLALIYTVIHATALFSQVITLNVAVNAYSNALITLLMSNQFVEIKSTVFKKFEKDNLFQLTCADVVERFQLWHMLMIIACRNIVENGILNLGFHALGDSSSTASALVANSSSASTLQAIPPSAAFAILPRSFTLGPAIISTITSYAPNLRQILEPFVMVLGSEMLVDWLKHAYINKFNNTRPTIYGRFLDVLAKDYYTNAFREPNLTKRLGLPVIPLSCLLIRASVQTYHMFIAAWVPSPAPSASASLVSMHEQYTASRATVPTSTVAAIVQGFDDLLGHVPSTIANSRVASYFTTVLILLLMFLVLLTCKLVLGMLLLSFARTRYQAMQKREKESSYQVEGGRRVGGWGVVEVDEDKRRTIYDDDPAGLRALREREEREKARRQRDQERGFNVEGFDKVKRYEMVAKRIW